MVLSKCLFVAVEEIPVQGGEGAGGWAGAEFGIVGAGLAVVGHARNKGKFEIKEGAIAITPDELDEHLLRLLIGAGEGNYDEFDLAKERETMWPRK